MCNTTFITVIIILHIAIGMVSVAIAIRMMSVAIAIPLRIMNSWPDERKIQHHVDTFLWIIGDSMQTDFGPWNRDAINATMLFPVQATIELTKRNFNE